MRYLSVCSGIEAATAAWHPLGWQAAAYSEIEAFPRAVLTHHYPDVPLHGDFTTIEGDEYGPIDLLVGGTPCQSFSVAGLRGGLADDRGNLALEFLRLAQRTRAKWLVWENVPGVLSSDGGRDFGSILGGLVELGYGFAYRVLDAQHFGVPQRRRRVFVVGYLGDWRRAAAVLFERHSLQGHSPPRREKGQRVADSLTVGANQCSGFPGDFTEARTGDISHCLNADGMGRQDYETETLIAVDVVPAMTTRTGTGTGRDGMDEYCVAHSGFRDEKGLVAIQGTCIGRHDGAGPQGSGFDDSGGMFTLTKSDRHGIAYGSPVDTTGYQGDNVIGDGDVWPCLSRSGGNNGGGGGGLAHVASTVRRLTPRECERLQGFPDDFTLVPYRGKPAADGPRYKALGNSMAVPVMAWLGERIAAVDAYRADPDRAESHGGIEIGAAASNVHGGYCA